MKSVNPSVWILVAAWAAAVAAHAQVPTGNDTSDGNDNTGMGSGALGGPKLSGGGSNNTASGYDALNSNKNGIDNTATGYDALLLNESGDGNTASGGLALLMNSTGSYNTAVGLDALYANNGSDNTALGATALDSNSTGSYNTATGANALFTNDKGDNNTATGFNALYSNTQGNNNTATGNDALYTNQTGNGNTATGINALYHNEMGNDNSATGLDALVSNTTGSSNSASGYDALYSNTDGVNNTAAGAFALYSNVHGTYNLALGVNAGFNITGSNNIDIGVRGNAGENGIIRIGTPGSQVQAYISGIENSKVTTGQAVFVTASGQLGVLSSSERYKTAIQPIKTPTEKVAQLRPVTFHFKSDPGGAIQYGLIAEEVNKVLPDLVVRDEKGVIQGVRYDELGPLLLSVVQQQQSKITAQEVKIRAQAAKLAEVSAHTEHMQQQLTEIMTLSRTLQAGGSETSSISSTRN